MQSGPRGKCVLFGVTDGTRTRIPLIHNQVLDH